MKLFTTLLVAFAATTFFSQHFVIDGSPKLIYANYNSATVPMGTLNSQYVIHGKEEMEITDIQSGKIVYEWDPKGKYGECYISNDGKWIANRSQNYDHPELGYVDAFQVLNTETKKEYLTPVPNELWQRMGFANVNKEIAISTYKYDGTDDKVRIILFDFINGKENKTIFKSSKSSTIILDLDYSLDDKYVYATIATNALTSYLYVFERDSGKQIAKTSLKHQANNIFVTPDKIIVSGAHGDHATEYTTIISPKDYSIIKDWKGKAIDNLDPTYTFSIIYDYDTKMLQTFDITTGEKVDILDAKNLNLYPISCAFTADGNYFTVAKSTSFEDRKTKKPGQYEVLYVLNNKLIDDPVSSNSGTSSNSDSVENNETPPSTDKWIKYEHTQPKLEVLLPSEAKVKEEKNSKGNNTVTISGSTKTEAGMISIIEIPTIKEKKYTAAAQKIGENFIKKKTPENIQKSTYSYNGQEGVQYTFKMGKFEYIYKVFCADGNAFQLFYLASDIDQVDHDTFFKSFTLK